MSFSLKNAYLKNHSKQDNNEQNNIRKEFGIREINTIIALAKYFLPEANLIKVNQKFYRRNNISLLDIGCGDKYLSHGCNAFEINYKGIDFDTCDIENESLKDKDNSFDIVTSLAIIEHLGDPSNLINESYRVLKKGGIIVISSPNWKYCVKDFYDDPTHIRPYTETSLAQVLKLSPFKSTMVIPNLRCKPKSAYTGKNAFFKAAKLRPFTNSPKIRWLPNFLKGKARGLFGIGIK